CPVKRHQSFFLASCADPVYSTFATSGKAHNETTNAGEQTMKSEVLASDPCPEIPDHFVDPTRILKLAREVKKQALPSEDAVKVTSEPEVGVETMAEDRDVYQPPEVKEKRFVASRVRWPDFGPILARAAWAWGFFGATRKAFLGDGSDNNWTIWRNYFS